MYQLHMRDGQCDHMVEMTEVPSAAEIEDEIEEWVNGGEWGTDGASVAVWWTLTDGDGDEADSGSHTVEVEPDHVALIRAAGGDPDCDHEWTSEGEGGCDENPGVWSHGGTAMTFASHCRICGLHRVEHATGSQRNPGEHDTVTYEAPESWRQECQTEDCCCEAAND